MTIVIRPYWFIGSWEARRGNGTDAADAWRQICEDIPDDFIGASIRCYVLMKNEMKLVDSGSYYYWQAKSGLEV